MPIFEFLLIFISILLVICVTDTEPVSYNSSGVMLSVMLFNAVIFFSSRSSYGRVCFAGSILWDILRMLIVDSLLPTSISSLKLLFIDLPN